MTSSLFSSVIKATGPSYQLRYLVFSETIGKGSFSPVTSIQTSPLKGSFQERGGISIFVIQPERNNTTKVEKKRRKEFFILEDEQVNLIKSIYRVYK